jgi:hypothetical protein
MKSISNLFNWRVRKFFIICFIGHWFYWFVSLLIINFICIFSLYHENQMTWMVNFFPMPWEFKKRIVHILYNVREITSMLLLRYACIAYLLILANLVVLHIPHLIQHMLHKISGDPIECSSKYSIKCYGIHLLFIFSLLCSWPHKILN